MKAERKRGKKTKNYSRQRGKEETGKIIQGKLVRKIE